VVALENKRNAAPVKSLETADILTHARPYLVRPGVEFLAPMLFKMRTRILVANMNSDFVTSTLTHGTKPQIVIDGQAGIRVGPVLVSSITIAP
jgi:hypothetical protein